MNKRLCVSFLCAVALSGVASGMFPIRDPDDCDTISLMSSSTACESEEQMDQLDEDINAIEKAKLEAIKCDLLAGIGEIICENKKYRNLCMRLQDKRLRHDYSDMMPDDLKVVYIKDIELQREKVNVCCQCFIDSLESDEYKEVLLAVLEEKVLDKTTNQDVYYFKTIENDVPGLFFDQLKPLLRSVSPMYKKM
jgi:hypothetical protein